MATGCAAPHALLMRIDVGKHRTVIALLVACDPRHQALKEVPQELPLHLVICKLGIYKAKVQGTYVLVNHTVESRSGVDSVVASMSTSLSERTYMLYM